MTIAPAELQARAILFDLDGVLADSSAAVERQWRRWATRHRLDAEALLRVVHGRRALDTIREVAPALDPQAELAWMVDAEAADTEGIRAVPGAASLLSGLPADRWAVVTSGVRRVALARLEAAGLPRPPLLVAADEIARGKPDPEGYLTAARRLGVPADRCVVVEDAPAGLAAARAAGMRCIGVTTTYPASALAQADWIVPSLEALHLVGVSAADAAAGPELTLRVADELAWPLTRAVRSGGAARSP